MGGQRQSDGRTWVYETHLSRTQALRPILGSAFQERQTESLEKSYRGTKGPEMSNIKERLKIINCLHRVRETSTVVGADGIFRYIKGKELAPHTHGREYEKA